MSKDCAASRPRSPHTRLWSSCTFDTLLEQVRHVTAETAMTRNRLVAEMADAVVVAHATRGGKMATLCRETVAAGKPLHTFEHPANELLIRDGARPVAELCAGSLGEGKT